MPGTSLGAGTASVNEPDETLSWWGVGWGWDWISEAWVCFRHCAGLHVCHRQVVTVLSDFGIRKLRAVKANNYSMAISGLGETQLMLFHLIFLLPSSPGTKKACEQARRLLENRTLKTSMAVHVKVTSDVLGRGTGLGIPGWCLVHR